ncbi:leucine-rich repeat-containing protein 66 isoform X1 [Centrocercus urophasianus]|uniref:leucine-rich repeat-containing protein 66 isoform X1 n=1 Tax=Centrocercus urophasianus TaxID=9002 RepID=UPI001C647A00|nr:leucine-rich repeat-containing protein 66 isoform X1 [Centrocercus urophasianus]
MDNVHLSVTAVLLLYFNHPRSVGTKQLLNTHRHTDCWWDEKFVVNCSFMGLGAIPEDISLTAVTVDLSYNNIKTFLCTTGRNEDWMLKHLNLSNNLISDISVTAFRNLPILETLNLNGNSISTLTLHPPTPAHGSKTLGEIHHFLPALKVLSAGRNNLHAVPTGLGLLQSLQTVHLSFNGILQIDLNDFHNCSQLKNIYLQNNKIANIHPDAFKGLNKLQVVDLRENPLTTILPHLLINLNIFQLKVDLFNNSWICNCRLHALKHLLRFFSASTREKLIASCSKTATSSQKPLLYLSSFHLNCSDSVLSRTAVVPPRETSVLHCSVGNALGNGVSWWTPKGKISKESSLPHLYMCTFNTTRKKYLIYNVQVKEKVPAPLVRKTRAANPGVRAGGTQQDLTLAVCLSVFITFLCAFCLGVLARPCLTRLWMRMCRNKAPAPEHIHANHAFSDETPSREHSVSNPMNTQHNEFVFYENSSRSTHASPTGTARLYENVIDGTGRTPSTEEFPKESNNEINIKKNSVSFNTKTNSSDAMYVNTGQLTARMDYENSSEVTPGKLMGNSLSTWKDPKYANSTDSEQSRVPPMPSRHNSGSHSVHTDPADTDLPCTGDAGFPLPTVQPQTSVQYSRDNEVGNRSGQQQSEATPEYKGNILHHEPISSTKFMLGRQSYDREFGLNSNVNMNSDVGNLILPSSSKRDANIENLSIHQKPENTPHTEHSCKRDCRNEQGNFADFFGDSSSDEGTLFTMSDCSSLDDFDLEQISVSSNLPAPLSSLEKADANGIGNFSAPLESLSIAAELRHIGKNGDKHNAYFGTTTDYGSDTIIPEAASAHTAKCSDHVSTSGSDSINSSPEVPDAFGYFTKESIAQNSISDSPYKHNTDFSNTPLSLKHSPTYATDTENTPEDAELQPHQFSFQPQHLLRHSPTEQKEHAPEVSTEQLTDESSSESDRWEGDAALRWNMNTSENNHFVRTPLDTGLNATVSKAPLPHASTASNKSPHPSLSENTTEKPSTVIMEKKSLPQGEHINSARTHEDKTQRGFSEECDEYRELQGSNNCSSSDEMQSCSVMTKLHLESPGKTQSVFNIDNYFQLDPSEENVYSSLVPLSSLSRSTQHSSGPFPQETAGNKTCPTTDPSELEGDTSLTAPESSSTTAASLPDSSGKCCQKAQTSLGQRQLFIKKKRAFDGFANILESRKADSDG